MWFILYVAASSVFACGTFIPANSVEKHFFNGRKLNETGKNIPEFVHLKLSFATVGLMMTT